MDQKLRCFLYIFRIYSLKIFAGGGLGARPGGPRLPVAPPTLSTPLAVIFPTAVYEVLGSNPSVDGYVFIE